MNTEGDSVISKIHKHGHLTSIGKCLFTKPVLVVYNPSSGKKRNVRAEISRIFEERSISFELYETKGYMDAWNRVRDCDLDCYSCVIAVGGDGTIHEVVNGMMFRTDEKKVPLAFVPNGTGNDTCHAIGIKTVDMALDAIRKSDTIKVDLNRVICDAKSLEELYPAERTPERIRYSIVNAGGGLIASINSYANNYKSTFGGLSYLAAAVKLFADGYPVP